MEQDDFNPDSILTDFEAATIKSVKGLSPRVLHKCCLFHYGQCTRRKIQDLSLKKKYQEDKSFHLTVKNLVALAFVPLSDAIKAYDLIVDEFDNDADELLNYSEETWIGKPNKRGTGRKKPLFPLELWNVYDRVCANLPHANNSNEGGHPAFAKRVAIVRPSINKLTDKIRQGHEPKPNKVLHRKLDERIKRLVDDYQNVDLGEYVSGLAERMNL